MALAHQIADRNHCNSINCLHILQAIIVNNKSSAATILHEHKINPRITEGKKKKTLMRFVKVTPHFQWLPLSTHAKKAFTLIVKRAEEQNYLFITESHLLVGIVSGDNHATEILHLCGVDLQILLVDLNDSLDEKLD